MNAGKLFGFAYDRRMVSKGKSRAYLCDNKTFKHIFYFVLFLGMFLWAVALLSFIIVFYLFSFC